MEYSFQRYLLAKQSVDDRAINRHVLEALKGQLPPPPIRVIEVGAGMGNMLARLLSWGVLTQAEYIHEDALADNLAFAEDWLPKWAAEAGLRSEKTDLNQLRIFDQERDVRIRLENADVLSFALGAPAPGDLLIAHAFLDLLELPQSLPKLLSLTKNLAWLTINFDGLTSLEPTIDAALDEEIVRLYHESMDSRTTGGDSRAGRHLFSYLRALGVQILAAGASDWVVHAVAGKYPADEAYFLHFILHFIEESLIGNAQLNGKDLPRWLEQRRAQIERGELVYIAHQMDFLARV